MVHARVRRGGKKVSGRSIASLAAEKGITWDQESTVVNGTGATKTRMELYLKDTLTKECQGGGGPVPDSQSVISIETFVFTGAATIEYGNETLEMSATSLKYNVKSTNWPFCDQGNSLQVNMDVKVKGDKPPKMEKKDMEKEEEERKKSGKKGKGVKGKKFKANAGKLDLEMDLPELTLVDGSLVDSDIDMDAKGSKTSITCIFPHFNETLLYDPTASLAQVLQALRSTMGQSGSEQRTTHWQGADLWWPHTHSGKICGGRPKVCHGSGPCVCVPCPAWPRSHHQAKRPSPPPSPTTKRPRVGWGGPSRFDSLRKRRMRSMSRMAERRSSRKPCLSETASITAADGRPLRAMGRRRAAVKPPP